MKNTKCPLGKRCWDYGDCEDCDIGIHTLGMYKQISRLKIKNAQLTKELANARADVAKAIIGEITEKLKFSNRIFKDCASNLVGTKYVDGRCDAYQEFVDILNGIVGKYLPEEDKDENT